MRCDVFGCNVDNQSKNFNTNIKFFSFPKDKKLLCVWKQLCKRANNFNITNARICSLHFNSDDYERNLKHDLLGYSPKNFRYLKKEAIPSQNLAKAGKDKLHSGREQRYAKRQSKQVVQTILKGVNTDIVVDDRDNLIASLQEKIKFLEEGQSIIGNLFSNTQLRKLEHSKTRLRWSVEDICKSIVIYSAGPRAYRLLLKKGYPFPAVSTLRSWLAKIKIAPGILKKVFNIMKFAEMKIRAFDEMKIRKNYLYDKANDETLTPYSYVQVVMLRGLFRSWKQPIFYDFDFKLSKDKLFELIQFVE
ncbi:uncharacterized protein [Diabrotica undecimpunctata]|uniref:uncharacterized protein n=1 Tax=Diabrotica undecimpunctata TaxID=50387 RepID=UPI003B635C84